jgi:glycosyltransferase involved in cell wall biosynthesis
MKLVSIVTPCFNEEENIPEVHRQVKEVFQSVGGYEYEHIFIDNASTDCTVQILKDIAEKDPRVKIIVNTRNFGHIRSPHHAFLQARGDAVIFLVADLQDPPGMIAGFLRKWEEGYKVVIGVRKESEESRLMFGIRNFYYNLAYRLSSVQLIKGFTGFGLYDRQVVEIIRGIDDVYPYFRGLVSEIGFEIARIEYRKPGRKRGVTKNSFYTLYDIAMLGITNHSKVPLRLATMLGFLASCICLLIALVYTLLKLVFWQYIPLGIAPLVIGLFLFASVQLFFIGIIGEYIGSIHTQVLRRPLVVEKERVNFD